MSIPSVSPAAPVNGVGDPLPTAVSRGFVLLAGLWILWFAAYGIAHGWLHLGYPYDHLTLPSGHRMDLLGFLPKWSKLHTAAFFLNVDDPVYQYPAPAAFLYEVLYLTRHCYVAYVAFAAMVMVGAATVLARCLKSLNVRPYAVTAVCTLMFALSYPVLFILVQANVELLLAAICSAALLLYLRGNYVLSAVLIGFAASAKIYPFVFLALFIPPRKYKALAAGAVSIIVSTVAALVFLGPTMAIAARGIAAGLRDYRATIVVFFDHQNSGFDHSLFGAIKRLLDPNAVTLTFSNHLLTAYLATMALCGCALWYFRIRKLPVLNQIVSLSLVIVIMPPVSYDYTLLHLYLPWSLLIAYACAARRDVKIGSGAAIALALFGVAFSPLNEFIYKACSFGGQLKCLALIAILYQSLRTPWTLAGLELEQSAKGAGGGLLWRSLCMAARPAVAH